MYSSVSEAEYQFRKARAEEEARRAQEKVSRDAPTAPASASSDAIPVKSGSGLLSKIKEDDLLLLGVLFLLFNENKDDDPLIFIILAILFFT